MDKLQPHNIEAEEAVIGSILIDPDAIMRVDTLLDPGDFWTDRYGWIYDAVRHLYHKRQPADLVTVSDVLQQRGQLSGIGGPATLTGLINACPSSIHVTYYAGIVADTADRRRLINTCGDIVRLAYDDGIDVSDLKSRSEEMMFAATSQHITSGPVPIADAMDRYVDIKEYQLQHPGAMVGIPTGLTDLDRLLGGLQRKKMYVLAGRPGMGKTSIALNMANIAAQKYRKRVAIFSLEMSDEELVERLVSAESGIDSQRLNHGKIKSDEWPAFTRACDSVSGTPIFIDDSPAISAMELRSKARRLHAEHGLDLVIVDYLQLMTGDNKSENRVQEISFISRSIKALARELNIPVLALSQLSRKVESRHDKRPMLSDLRESGSIEQDADVVVFVYRDEVYNPDSEFPNIAELIVSKHRAGPTGIFSVYFKKRLAQFVDLEVRSAVLEYEIVPRGGNGPRPLDEIVNDYHNGKNGNGIE